MSQDRVEVVQFTPPGQAPRDLRVPAAFQRRDVRLGEGRPLGADAGRAPVEGALPCNPSIRPRRPSPPVIRPRNALTRPGAGGRFGSAHSANLKLARQPMETSPVKFRMLAALLVCGVAAAVTLVGTDQGPANGRALQTNRKMAAAYRSTWRNSARPFQAWAANSVAAAGPKRKTSWPSPIPTPTFRSNDCRKRGPRQRGSRARTFPAAKAGPGRG